MVTNLKIRVAMTEHQFTQWKLARLLGVSESTIYRMIREELPEEEQDRIVDLIRKGGESDE